MVVLSIGEPGFRSKLEIECGVSNGEYRKKLPRSPQNEHFDVGKKGLYYWEGLIRVVK